MESEERRDREPGERGGRRALSLRSPALSFDKPLDVEGQGLAGQPAGAVS